MNMRFAWMRTALVPTVASVVILACSLACTSLYGQVVGATLSGTINDNSGAVIPNAQLSIKDVATGVTRDLTTDTAGFYTAPNLSPGSYEVNVTAAGFKTIVRSGITLKTTCKISNRRSSANAEYDNAGRDDF